MVRRNSWLQLLWWDYASFGRGGGWGQQTEGEWQCSSGAHVTATASHRAPCPTRPLWRLETNILMRGGGAVGLTASNEHFHSSLHFNQGLEHASQCSQPCSEEKLARAARDWHVFPNSPFSMKSNCVANVKHKQWVKASLFSAAATHSHEFSNL